MFPKNSVYKDESDGDSTALSLVTPAKNADPIDGLSTHILPDALANDPETGALIDYPYQKAGGAKSFRVDGNGNLILVSIAKRVPTHEPYQQHENTNQTRFSRSFTDREGIENSTGGKTAPYVGSGDTPKDGFSAPTKEGQSPRGSTVKKPSFKNWSGR